MFDPGILDKRVSIYRPPTTRDDYGHQSGAWEPVATVWANVRPIGGRERLRAGQYDATLTHTVAVRYNPALLPPRTAVTWRLLYLGRLFNIVAAMDVDESHEYIIFDCTEGSADGQ